MEHIPIENVNELLATWDGEIEYQLPEAMECPGGVCEIPQPGTLKNEVQQAA